MIFMCLVGIRECKLHIQLSTREKTVANHLLSLIYHDVWSGTTNLALFIELMLLKSPGKRASLISQTPIPLLYPYLTHHHLCWIYLH
jgi:hypothetical protein